MWVDISHFIEGLNRAKVLSKRELHLPDYLSRDIGPAHRLEFTPSAPLVPRPSDLDLGYTSSTPGSPACQQQTGGLVCLYNLLSQFL